MTEHPTPTILTDFLLGRLASKPARAVIGHLLHGCVQCRETMEPLAMVILSGRAFGQQEPAQEEQEAYDGAISGACRKVMETLREERARIPAVGTAILSRFSEAPRRASAPAPRPASR